MEIIVPECAAERRIVQFVALQSVELFELCVNSGVVVQLWVHVAAAAHAHLLGAGLEQRLQMRGIGYLEVQRSDVRGHGDTHIVREDWRHIA